MSEEADKPLTNSIRKPTKYDIVCVCVCVRMCVCVWVCVCVCTLPQLVLPPPLRPLPVYINSLRKSEVLLPGLRSSVHQRLQLRCQVLRMDASSTATHFYPLLLPLVRRGSARAARLWGKNKKRV